MSFQEYGCLSNRCKRMDKEKLKIEHLLSNAEFRDWVFNPSPISESYWKNWMNIYPERKASLLKAREILLSLKYQAADEINEDEKNKILKNILNDREKPLVERFGSSRKKHYFHIAASVLLLSLTFIYTGYLMLDGGEKDSPILIVKENPKGQKTRVSLPDGSKVWLNSASRLEYQSNFFDGRNITLIGEAFFEVTENPNAPFKVISQGIAITALGTSFNVRAFENEDVEVGLVTGKVKVESAGTGAQTLLSPGQKTSFNAAEQRFNVSILEQEKVLAWTKRTIIFEKASFEEVKNTLERWYDVDIRVSGFAKDIRFSGEFHDESLQRVLERIAFVEKFSFKKNGKQVEIFFE